jgi:Lon protease-like protein
MARLLTLFPLQLVALPGNPLALHIFEPRYRQLVGDAAVTGAEFGIVLAKDGGIVNAGCTVSVENITERYPDGTFDIIARGRRRFSILSVDTDDECLRAEVEYFSDDDVRPAAPEYRTRALRACQELHASLPEDTPEPVAELTDPELSFRLAPTVHDLDFLDTILRQRSETHRLELIIEVAPKFLERAQYVRKMKQLVPTNGNGHKPKAV